MSYQITHYAPEHKRQIADLRDRVWGGTIELNTKYIEWKYEQNPYLDGPHLYVALFKEDVVGTQAMYGNAWVGAGLAKQCVIPCGADFIVDQDHRGQALGSKLVTYKLKDVAEKKYSVAVELSANPLSRGIFSKAGFKKIAAYETLLRGVAAKPTLISRALGKIRRLVHQPKPDLVFASFDAWAAQKNGEIHGALEPRISEMSDLVSRNRNDAAICHVRDEVYYRWRLRNPLAQYRFVYHESEGTLDGFLVLQMPIEGKRATIIDWESSTDEIWCKLITAAVESGVGPLAIISAKYTENQMTVLKRAGFESVAESVAVNRPGPGIYLKTLSGEDCPVSNANFNEVLTSHELDMRIISSDAY